MAFDLRGFIENAERFPVQAQQMVRDHDTRGQAPQHWNPDPSQSEYRCGYPAK